MIQPATNILKDISSKSECWTRPFKKGRIKRRSDERGGKIEISVERFKTLVEALEALPEGIRGDSALINLRGFSGFN
jgi:hypothetical protein